MRRLLYAVVPLALASCGGSSAAGWIGAGGGELCLPDRRVCISVPLNGLENETQLYIRPSSDSPGGGLSETWEIGPDRTYFLKEATVTFRYDVLDAGFIELNPSLVRIYTRDLSDGGYGDWQALNDSEVDRVRLVVRGNTPHLSPFVLLRTDRLSDGGMPVEGDAGTPKDGGNNQCLPPICNPPSCTDNVRNNFETDIDCGGPQSPSGEICRRCEGGKICEVNGDCLSNRCQTNFRCRPVTDGGMPDAGFDAGTPDAGTPDAGRDAGFDAGTPDAGRDAGVDAGFDAGTPDAGSDAGFDAGFDAGVDAGEPDAGEPDAGEPDAGGLDGGEDAGDGG